MNTKIAINQFFTEVVPRLFLPPLEYFPRQEKCPICKVNLSESFYWDSNKPKDSMMVRIGHKYNRFLVSSSIYCPKCKINFAHEKTSANVIEGYLNIANNGGFYAVKLKRSFVVSKFDTELKENLVKGTVVYTSAKSALVLKEKPSFFNSISKIKDGYTKDQGFKEVNLGGAKVDWRIEKRWERIQALSCVLNVEDIFYPSANMIRIPIDLFSVTKNKELI